MSGPLLARLDERTVLSPTIVDFRLRLIDPPRITFAPGQFVTALLPDATGKTHKRSYSIASLPSDGESLRVLLRLVEHGVASTFFRDAKLGTEVRLTGPHGVFVLAPDHPGDVVFAATGTGIAPALPMLDELRRRPRTGVRLVYWGVRLHEDLFAVDEIAAACRAADAELLIYLSAPHDLWSGGRGRIVAPILERFPTLAAPTFYIVGNGAMIKELKAGLLERGVDRKKQVRTEVYFT